MLSRLFPGLLWLEGYRRSTFRQDFFSGLTIAVMLIPQGMGYALVAGLPPEYGLYACVFPPIIYALLGTSNKISIGPVALDAILIITGLSLIAEPGSDRYLELAVTLTLMVGVIQSILGMLRFGFIANFLSYPVIVGYTSAAALIIMVSQFENLVGANVDGGNVFELCYALLKNLSDWNWVTVAFGGFGLLFMVLPKRWMPSLPYALLLLVLGMVVSGMMNARSYGVDVVSFIPQGLPALSMPSLSVDDLMALLPVALTVALMGYVGSMSICKSLEKPTDKMSARPNQELIAVGLANFVGAFFKAFPVSASFSRSAAFRQAGALTQVSALVSSLFIIVTLLFLTPLFAGFPLPKALLSAVIIVSVVGLFKHAEMKALFRRSLSEFGVLMVTFSLTLLFGVQTGLIIGVILSILMVIYKTANPHMTELGAIQGGSLYRNVTRFGDAYTREDVLIFRFDAPLYFANKDQFVERLYHWIKQRDKSALQYVVFDAEAVNSIDCTATQMLKQVIENLRAQEVEFYISNAIGPVRDTLKESELSDYVSEKTMFSTINDAILYIDNGINVHAQEALQTNHELEDKGQSRA